MYSVVVSAYSKDNVQNLINGSDILYVDSNENRTNTWLSSLRLQLPSEITKYGSISNSNISTNEQDVNIETEKKYSAEVDAK